ARRRLGDARFSTLLLTINRRIIKFKEQDGKRVPDLREGQILWLPTPSELRFHREFFFGKEDERAPHAMSGQGSMPGADSYNDKELIFTPPKLEIIGDDSKASEEEIE